MRVLITGAQGFVGRYLAARWLDMDSHIEIAGCGRSPANAATFTHAITVGSRTMPAPLPPELCNPSSNPRYRYFATDLLDDERLTALIADVRPEVIVHLASGLRDDPTEKLLRTNVLGVERLYCAMGAAGHTPPRVVLGSSGSVYGAVAEEALPIREETPPAPFDMYSISKVAEEQVARMLGRRLAIPTTVVRIFNIVGPGQDERHFCGGIAAQIVDIETGRRPPAISIGPLTTTRDFIDVRDVANGLILAALHSEGSETCNLASGQEIGMQQVFDEMLALACIPNDLQIVRKPGRKADMQRNAAAIDRIARYGFTPCFSLRQSLSDVIEYYRRLDHGAC
ncbi:MAG TPA: NAD(P)-dependent oxidoreductase [Bryobacteraceae bacterium]|nr:NAD(P)-dependent oxidoreductase [Bryobacteraceae bacterium]